MRDTPSTWDSIIDALGGTSGVATALEQSLSTVSGWRSRGIPAPHWAGVVALASSLDRSDITLEVLAELASRKLLAAEEVRA